MALMANLNQAMPQNNFRPMMGGLGVPGQMGQNTVMPSRPMFGNGPVGLPTPMRGTALQGPQVPGLTGPINGGTNPLQSPALQPPAGMNAPGVNMYTGAGVTPGMINYLNQMNGPVMGNANGSTPGMYNGTPQMGGPVNLGTPGLTGQPGMGPQNGQQMAPQGPMSPMGGMYGGMTAPQRPMGMIPMTGPQGASSFDARFPSQ
jgi:hypothetical protein